MLRSFSIVRFIAGLLLLLLAVGITPKIYLHDLFAKHIDTSKKRPDVPFQLGNAGYSCNCDNQVAESPFESTVQVFSVPVFYTFPDHISTGKSLFSIAKTYRPLRGPPVKI